MSKGARWTPEMWREYQKKQEAAKTSKYGGIPTTTADGVKHPSHVEAAYHTRCQLLLQAGEISLVERQVRYELEVNGEFICDYLLDFRVTYKDGRVEYVDTKSKATLTPLYRIKKKLMKACHNIDLKEVFWEDFK